MNYTEGSRKESSYWGEYSSCEELLMQISALFINLPLDSIDHFIEEALRRICECLDLDLSVLWQWSGHHPKLMTITHYHAPPDFSIPPENIDGANTHPYIYEKLVSGESLAFSNSDLPSDAHIDVATRKRYGVESSIAIPLATGGEPLFGILSFDTLNRSRSWNDKEVKLLKLAAEILASAIARKNAEQALVESKERMSLAAESAGAGLWEINLQSKEFWTTEKARELYGYSADERITLSRFEQSVCKQDLKQVRRAITEALTSNKQFLIEYRITDPQGEPKWICTRGRPYFHGDGSPDRVTGFSVDISEKKRLEEALYAKLEEVEHLKQQIEQENFYLREELRTEQGFEQIIGSSKEFSAVMTSANQVAPTEATVLLLGETGTGKGVVADAIHRMSDRKKQPFVTVNCAALPHNLIESELFGRKKGAFTGAHADQAGRFQVANHGTIFLDEIGEMPLEMQAKLLRVLQEGEFERLGSSATVQVDVRIIAATGRDLKKDVQDGRFREDLFYRLNVFPISIPPLRKRISDIPLLIQHFVNKYSAKMGKQIDRIPNRILTKMTSYSWPGNVRELEHLVERSVILSSGNILALNDQLFDTTTDDSGSARVMDLQTNEKDHIIKVLSLTQWKIEGPGGAAAILDIHPSTLRFRLKKFGIQRPY